MLFTSLYVCIRQGRKIASPKRMKWRGGGRVVEDTQQQQGAGRRHGKISIFLGLHKGISCILDAFYDNLKAPHLVYFVSQMKTLRGYATLPFSLVLEKLQGRQGVQSMAKSYWGELMRNL
jgi:hypothetical protein